MSYLKPALINEWPIRKFFEQNIFTSLSEILTQLAIFRQLTKEGEWVKILGYIVYCTTNLTRYGPVYKAYGLVSVNSSWVLAEKQ